MLPLIVHIQPKVLAQIAINGQMEEKQRDLAPVRLPLQIENSDGNFDR